MRQSRPKCKIFGQALSTDKLYIIYDDGIIREWNIQSPRIPHPIKLYQIDFKGIENVTLLEFPKDYLNILISNDFLYCLTKQSKEGNRLEILSEFKTKPDYKILSLKEKSVLLQDGDSKVRLIDIRNLEVVKSINFVPFSFYENLGFDGFFIYNEADGLKIMEMPFNDGLAYYVKESQDVTCIHSFACDENKYLIGWGQKNGQVNISKLIKNNNLWKYSHVLKHKSHDGMVKDFKFINSEKIVSAGSDKKLSILEFDKDKENQKDIVQKELQLKLRCKGIKIDGVKSKLEYEKLKELRDMYN